MTVKEAYGILGDYDDAIDRFMSDEMIVMFVGKFVEDKSYGELVSAAKSGDRETAFRAAHTLKGVAANMGFTKLCEVASELTEQLRPLDRDVDDGLLKAVETRYKEVIDTIGLIEA